MVKCDLCKRKINVIEQEYCKCRCGKQYCGNHIFAYQVNSSQNSRGHLCEYNYKKENVLEINQESKYINLISDNLLAFKNFERL